LVTNRAKIHHQQSKKTSSRAGQGQRNPSNCEALPLRAKVGATLLLLRRKLELGGCSRPRSAMSNGWCVMHGRKALRSARPVLYGRGDWLLLANGRLLNAHTPVK